MPKKPQRSLPSTRVTSDETRTQSAAFQSIFSSLNPAQRQAVESIEGPVMVAAGPGTGKTQILAARIANILRTTDVAAHNILALTFTETGAKAMRERLLTMIGELAYYVNISTFHAFCSDVIQSNPEYFPFSREAEPLSDLERYTIVEGIITEQPFEHIKPLNAPNFYVFEAIKAIQNLKREGVTPDNFRKMLANQESMLETEKLSATERTKRTKQLNRNTELLQVYILYQKRLQELSRYDFEDMISYTVEAFEKDKPLLQTYQERLQYILVDEYQDTNNAQNRVLELLAEFWGQEANIFVVGDVSQSLYRFQGASIENNLAFVKKYPKAKIITLRDNYRSSQLILDAATELISHNAFKHDDVLKLVGQKRTGSVLVAKQKIANSPIEIAALSSSPLEAACIAERISALIATGTDPSEIAVLYRNNADSAMYADALAKWGIKYEVDGGSNALESPVIQQFLMLCGVVESIRAATESTELFTVLNYDWIGLNDLDIMKLTRFAHTKKTTIYNALLHDDLPSLKLAEPDKLIEFAKKITEWSQKDAQLSFPEWFELVLYESGFLDWVLRRPDAVEQLNTLQSLFSEIKRMASANRGLNLTKFVETIATMREHHIKINEEDLNVHTQAVHLSTAHRAKGLEWEHVFIVNALDGKWGNVRVRELITLPEGIIRNTKLEQKEQNEDERRLFYVALTRAKKQVVVTYPKTTISANRSKDNFPTMFLEELSAKFKIAAADVDAFEQNAQVLIVKLLRPTLNKQPSIEEKEWLESIIADLVLTPTALNTYLECAYKFKLNTLLKVPRAKEDYLAFGTAVHRALEMLYRYVTEHDGEAPTKEYVLAQFEKALQKEILTDQNYERRLLHGQKILSAYYDEYKHEFRAPLFLEKFFGYGWSKTYVGDVRVGGRVDRIDWVDPKAKTVRVIDYKTGQPKSRNEIEGKTASGTGGYKRQLVFYKMLAELDRSFTAKVANGVFDFVEPDKKTKKFKRVEFELGKEEVEELQALIQETMTAIRKQEFPRTTNYSICHTCEFNTHCWPEGIPKEKTGQLQLV